VLSEPARSAENFFIFFGYLAVIPTCGVVRRFRKIHRWVGEGGVSCSAFLFFFEKKKFEKKIIEKKYKKQININEHGYFKSWEIVFFLGFF